MFWQQNVATKRIVQILSEKTYHVKKNEIINVTIQVYAIQIDEQKLE